MTGAVESQQPDPEELPDPRTLAPVPVDVTLPSAYTLEEEKQQAELDQQVRPARRCLEPNRQPSTRARVCIARLCGMVKPRGLYVGLLQSATGLKGGLGGGGLRSSA